MPALSGSDLNSASFTVRAEDLGRVRRIGYRVTTSAGVHIDSGSVVRTTMSSTDTHTFHVRFGQQYRGQTVIIYSFADDTAGNRSYSVASNVNVPQMNVANARVDRPLLVYGRTFALPAGGSGASSGGRSCRCTRSSWGPWSARRARVTKSEQRRARPDALHGLDGLRNGEPGRQGGIPRAARSPRHDRCNWRKSRRAAFASPRTRATASARLSVSPARP